MMHNRNGPDAWLSELTLDQVVALFRTNGVQEILYKILPANANSKNQVYFASDLSQLSKIPTGEVRAYQSTSQKNGGVEAVFRAPLDFWWIDADGQAEPAPDAKLIFYPQYPEVRFSGFLRGCRKAPSSLWVKEKRGTEPDRILLLGLSNGRKVFGLILPPEAPATREIRTTQPDETYGLFGILRFVHQDRGDSFHELMRQLCHIHRQDWVTSRRLDRDGNLVPCRASNCNGNTLEALLGIRSNGYAAPDFEGWEIKARSVRNLDNPGTTVVTLFTPEPTSGVYVDAPLAEFMHRYGYPDTQGRPDRLNFGGPYRAGRPAYARTGLRMVLDGFDSDTTRYRADGAIRLLDASDNEAMAWSFAKLLDHWKVKHAHAAYVPCENRTAPERQYRYGRHVLLGEGAEFRLFLKAVADGTLYYDPGIKLVGVSTGNPKPKKRSQFRISSRDLPALYLSSRVVDACQNGDNSEY